MRFCVSCYDSIDENQKALRYPSYELDGEKWIHKSCLLSQLDMICQDSKYQKLIKFLVNYEEEHIGDWSKKVSNGSADASWEWDDAGIKPAEAKKLRDNKVVGIIFNTNNTTAYALTGRETIKEYFEGRSQLKSSVGSEITTDVFDLVVGYDEIKKRVVKSVNRVIKGKPPVHFLAEGVPSSGKSTFMDCLGDALGDLMYTATGANTTEAGLSEALMEGHTVLCIDEIDFLDPKAMNVLLRFMEEGEVLQTKHKRTGERARHNTMVFGACNSTGRMPDALLSRFKPYHLYFPPYNREQFIEVCEGLLVKREGIKSQEIARYIGERLYNNLGTNADPRDTRGLTRMIDEETKEAVNEELTFLSKSGKYFRG